MKTPTLLRHATLVLPSRLIRADLLIENGRIARIEPSISPRPVDEVIDATGKYLLPGFIDIHNHGARGFDCSLGIFQPKSQEFYLEASSYREGLERALAYYLQKGTTRVLNTSLAAPLDDLEFSFRQIHQFLTETDHPLRPLIAGINLEGTFLKLPEYAGAQSPDYFYSPTKETFERLNEAAGGRLRMVNLPPEHGEPGLELIRYIQEQGVVVSAGHTGAEGDEFEAAVEAGTRLGIHFLNGPSRSSSKSFHNAGAEEAMLREDRVSLELIVDGYHVHPAYVRDVIARKGVERTVMITDSMFVNGDTEVKNFQLCGIPGAVSDNREYLQVTDKPDTLFGSVLTPDRGFENMINWLTSDMTGIWHRRHEALSLDEALIAASRMASGNPACLLGIDKDEYGSGVGTGSLEVGKWADLIVGEIIETENGYRFGIERVLLRGATS